jgi:valyl-tRNA synthetase
MNVPAGLKIPLIMISLDVSKRPGWDFNTNLIMKLARIEKITENAKLPKGCVNITVVGGEFALPLAEIIDISEEKKRLEKNLTKIENELKSINGRLENNKFLESAPESVVAQTKIDNNLKQEEFEKITNAIARLRNIEEA